MGWEKLRLREASSLALLSTAVEAKIVSDSQTQYFFMNEDSMLGELMSEALIKQPRQGWHMMCLKCGLQSELRRWKQNRHWECRKVGSKPRGKGVKRSAMDGWEKVGEAIHVLSHLQDREQVSLTAVQRRELVSLAELAAVTLRQDSHQGPKMKIPRGLGGRRYSLATANVGSLAGKVQGVTHVADAVAIQESGVSRTKERAVRGEARALGAEFFSGSPAATRTDSLGRTGPAKGQGLAVICQAQTQWFGLDRQLGAERGAGKRVHSGWLILGPIMLVLHNVYCKSGLQASWSDSNSELISEVVRRVSESPSEAQIVAGDFQCSVHQIDAFQPLLQNGWLATSQWPSLEGCPTNHPVQGQARVIDGMLISPSLLPILKGVEIVPLPGMSTHDAVCVTLEGEECRRKGTKLVPPVLESQLEPRGKGTWPRGGGQDYDHFLVALEGCLFPGSSSLKGRVGRVRREQCDLGFKRGPRCVPPSSWTLCVIRKALAHAEETLGLFGKENRSRAQEDRLGELYGLLNRIPWTRIGVHGSFPWTGEGVSAAVQSLRQLLETSKEKIARTLHRWKYRLREAASRQTTECSRWVREEQTGLRGIATSEGVVIDPMAIAEKISDSWRPVFQTDPEWSPQNARSGFPDFRSEYLVPDLCASDMRWSFSQKTKGAHGAERITGAMLARMPDPGWEHLAALFNHIEGGEEWPSDLLWVRLAPLRKPDAPDLPEASKVRLISIESILVRIWASVRFHQLLPWVQNFLGTGIIGGLPGKEALVEAASRDAERAVSDNEYMPYGELSFDFAKCYDTLPRSLLIQLALCLGLPRRIGGALERFLNQTERVVVFRGWVGGAVSGDRGVPQGNALSVLLTLVWTNVWFQQARSLLSPLASVCAFYDDLSVGSGKCEDIRIAWGLTAQFATDWGVSLNPSKSTLTMNRAAVAQWEVGDVAVPHAGSWSFIGVCLGASKTSEKSIRRVRVMYERLERLQTFPGEKNDVAKVVASMVNSLAYGLCFEVGCLKALKDMCGPIWRICWGSARYAASRGWTWASALPYATNPVTRYWLEAARLIWKLSNSEAHGVLALKLWDLEFSEREQGIWGVFTRIVREVGGRTCSGGDVKVNGMVMMSVHAPLQLWNHQARKIMKMWWAGQSRISQGELRRVNWDCLSRLVGKGSKKSVSVATMLSGSFLCAAKLYEHFGDMSPLCSCGQLDTQMHRMMWCPKLRGDRLACSWETRDEEVLRRGGPFWAERGVCVIPERLCSEVNPAFHSGAYLGLLGREDVEEAKRIASGQGHVLSEIAVRRWHKGMNVVAAAYVSLCDNYVIHCVNGLGKNEAYYACVFKVAIVSRAAQKRCCIRSDVILTKEAFQEWLWDQKKPWANIRSVFRTDGLEWLSFSEVQIDPQAMGRLNEWGRTKCVSEVLDSLEEQDKVGKKLSYLATCVGERFDTGFLAHKKGEARKRASRGLD